MLGCSGLTGRLTSTPWASLVTLVNDDMPSRVGGHGTSRWQLARIIGHGAMAGRSRAGRGVGAFAEWAQQNAAWAVARVDRRPGVASVCASGRWIALASLSVLVFGAKNNGSAGESSRSVDVADTYTGAGARRGAGSQETQPAACQILENLVGDDGVRGTSRPQPPPSEEGVAVRYTSTLHLRDDGSPAGSLGSPAGQPSNPG